MALSENRSPPKNPMVYHLFFSITRQFWGITAFIHLIPQFYPIFMVRIWYPKMIWGQKIIHLIPEHHDHHDLKSIRRWSGGHHHSRRRGAAGSHLEEWVQEILWRTHIQPLSMKLGDFTWFGWLGGVSKWVGYSFWPFHWQKWSQTIGVFEKCWR